MANPTDYCKKTLRALIRQPLAHFLAIGVALFATERLLPSSAREVMPIVIDGDDVARLRDSWLRETGSAPTPAQLRASIARHTDEELLVDEALRLQLDERDPVVRAHLLRNMRFAFPQRRAGEAALLRDARMLDMSRRDPVVRRCLIQAMERRLTADIVDDEAAVRAYFERNIARYGQPARYGFRQVFFSADIARADPHGEAERLRALLMQGVARTQAGDPFLLGAQIRLVSEDQIAQRFGVAFAQAIAEAPVGQWIGPLASPYGLHLVRIEHRVPKQMSEFARVARQVMQDWRAERREQVLRAALDTLHESYRVEAASSGTAWTDV